MIPAAGGTMGRPGYLVVKATLRREHEESLAELLGGHGVLGAQLLAGDDGRLQALIFLDHEHVTEQHSLLCGLEALGAGSLRVELVPDEDWLAAYRARARPFKVGASWWIEPDPASRAPVPRGRRRLIVEPRMAFGTGAHESTHLILLDLEEEPPTAQRLLDVGTGSGILSLAALRLGASWAVGVDIDPQAVFVARQVAGAQDVPCHPKLVAGSLDCVGDVRFDRVVCNMMASELFPLLPQIRRVLGPAGVVVFSGILADEEAEVRARLTDRGFTVEPARRLGDWVSLRGHRA